jgi:flagellar biosynthesis/type III secretory pathway M-ring protein FliF/YscJ
MKFAEDGLPKGGGVGYEIFDKSDHSAPPASSRTSITCALEASFPHHPGD